VKKNLLEVQGGFADRKAEFQDESDTTIPLNLPLPKTPPPEGVGLTP